MTRRCCETSEGGKLVFNWDEIDEENQDLFGQKCARLAVSKRALIPIPPFFAVTQCGVKQILEQDEIPAHIEEQIEGCLSRLAHDTQCSFGETERPLVVAVRSGDPFSMAGAMFSYLNVGVNDSAVDRLIEMYGDERCFLQMYLDSIIDHSFKFERHQREELGDIIAEIKAGACEPARLRELIEDAKSKTPTFPQDARRHLSDAIRAVAWSWHNYVTSALREEMEVEQDLLPSIFVQQMAFGNLSSSAFLAFCTRNPISGEPHFYGDFAHGTEGRKMMRGIGPQRHPIDRLVEFYPDVERDLHGYSRLIESLFKRPQDIEAVIERGRLKFVQIVDAHLAPAARRKICADLQASGVLAPDEQIAPIPGIRRTRVFKTYKLRPGVELTSIARGQPVYPGVAEGRLALSVYDAIRLGLRHGKRTILVLSAPDERALPMLLKRQVEGFAASYASTHDVAAAMLSHLPSIMSVNAVAEDNNYLVAEDGTRIAAGERVILDGTTGRLYLTPDNAEPALLEDEPILVTPHDLIGSQIDQITRDANAHLSYEELLAAHAKYVAETIAFIGERRTDSLSNDETIKYAELELVTHFIHIMIFERAKERGLSYVEAQLDVAMADGSLDRVPGLEHKRIALERDGDKVVLVIGTEVSYEHESIEWHAFEDGERREILRLLKEDEIPVRQFSRQAKLSRHTQFVTTRCLEFEARHFAAVVARIQQVEAASRA